MRQSIQNQRLKPSCGQLGNKNIGCVGVACRNSWLCGCCASCFCFWTCARCQFIRCWPHALRQGHCISAYIVRLWVSKCCHCGRRLQSSSLLINMVAFASYLRPACVLLASYSRLTCVLLASCVHPSGLPRESLPCQHGPQHHPSIVFKVFASRLAVEAFKVQLFGCGFPCFSAWLCYWVLTRRRME